VEDLVRYVLAPLVALVALAMSCPACNTEDFSCVWTPEERQAWAPPRSTTTSEWADRHRELAPGKSSEPGRWRTDRTPYGRAIMNAMGDRWTEEVVFMKSPQVGGSEFTRNAVGRWIDEDPAPCMIVFPGEQSARENLDERLIPMIKSTPRLLRHMTPRSRDLKSTALTLRTMQIYPAHAGSPQSLATRPCRYVICDEVDKYPPFAGREADPVSLAEARTRTYGHRRKLILVSTPTTKHGLIYSAFSNSPCRLHFSVSCPGCGHPQGLRFEGLRWGEQGDNPKGLGGPCPEDENDRLRLGDELEAGKHPVWYACERCDGVLYERDKIKLLSSGVWVDQEGLEFEPGRSARVAFHVSSLYSPWVSWRRVVVEFRRSRSTPQLMMNFMNNWLGLPYEEEQVKLDADLFEQKMARGGPRGVAPPWTRFIIVAADTGADHAWYTVRAWGDGYRSRLLDWGRVWSLDELKGLLDTSYPVEGDVRPPVVPCLLGIDTGGTGERTDEVYRWSLQDHRIACLKGHARQEAHAPVKANRVTYKPPGDASPYDVQLNLVNVHHYKDVLAFRLRHEVKGVELWQECLQLDDAYCQQMVSEHKVLERQGTKMRLVWRPLAKGVPNHLWDCNVYQCALADMIRLDRFGELKEPEKTVERAQPKQPKRARPKAGLKAPNGRPFLASRR